MGCFYLSTVFNLLLNLSLVRLQNISTVLPTSRQQYQHFLIPCGTPTSQYTDVPRFLVFF